MEFLGKKGFERFAMYVKEFVRTKAVTLTGAQTIFGTKTFNSGIISETPVGGTAYGFIVKSTETEPIYEMRFAITGGGGARGLYDVTLGKWLIYYNTNEEMVFDNGATVGDENTPVYLNAGVITPCSASLTAASISPLSTERLASLSLTEVKEHRNAELTAAFNEHISGSFTTTNGYTMQFSPTAILSLQCGIAANSTYLTQADNTTVYDLTPEILASTLAEMQQAYSACHARKQELRAKIDAAEDKDALVAISFEWPV